MDELRTSPDADGWFGKNGAVSVWNCMPDAPGPVVEVALALEPLLGVFDHARCGIAGEKSSGFEPPVLTDGPGIVEPVSERGRPEPVTDASEGGMGQPEDAPGPGPALAEGAGRPALVRPVGSKRLVVRLLVPHML